MPRPGCRGGTRRHTPEPRSDEHNAGSGRDAVHPTSYGGGTPDSPPPAHDFAIAPPRPGILAPPRRGILASPARPTLRQPARPAPTRVPTRWPRSRPHRHSSVSDSERRQGCERRTRRRQGGGDRGGGDKGGGGDRAEAAHSPLPAGPGRDPRPFRRGIRPEVATAPSRLPTAPPRPGARRFRTTPRHDADGSAPRPRRFGNRRPPILDAPTPRRACGSRRPVRGRVSLPAGRGR